MSWYHQGLRSQARKAYPNNFVSAVAASLADDVILLDWVNRGAVRTNWGDAVAPILVEWLSGLRVVNQRDVYNWTGRSVYTSIGSMLGVVQAPNTVVWGTGFVESRSVLQMKPQEICAVRGPLTRARLIELGVKNCPEVYGDPAWLFPRLYQPSVEKQYRLGLIPHYREFHLPCFDPFRKLDDVTVIDIRGGITEVADEINKCDYIASGSLHGLVLSDGYRIPTMWLKQSDRPYGGGFKFRDYFSSVGRSDMEPISLDECPTVDALLKRFPKYTIEFDDDKLLSVCPFLSRDDYESRTIDKLRCLTSVTLRNGSAERATQTAHREST